MLGPGCPGLYPGSAFWQVLGIFYSLSVLSFLICRMGRIIVLTSKGLKEVIHIKHLEERLTQEMLSILSAAAVTNYCFCYRPLVSFTRCKLVMKTASFKLGIV